MIYLHFKILMTSELSSMGCKGFLLSSVLFQKWRLGMAKNFPRIGSKVWKNTQRVNARAPERGRAVDERLRAGPGLSQRSFAVRSLLPRSPSITPTAPTTHTPWSSRARLASGVSLSAEQWSVCFWTFFFFLSVCGQIHESQGPRKDKEMAKAKIL